MLEIILSVISAIICIICGYYVGVVAGKKETCDIVKENNKEVLAAREHIEYQIQNEKAHLKSLQDNVEQQKKSFEDFEKLEKENIMKNLRDFQIQVNEDKAEYAEQIQLLQSSLDKLKRQKAATIEAFQREQAVQDSKDDYRIIIEDNDKADIDILNSFKNRLSNPEILSKLIWSTYFQKKAKALFINIVGTEKVCGIYKITNINDMKCYVGQSVDIANRFTQHCRCGCGIKTPKDNKLYAAMLKDGLDQFTFEIVEICPQEELNEKEKYYIDVYNSVNYGFNSQDGVNGKSND
uniref:Intron associated endonuclease n=1 Tax=Siphoviridae sp. ctnPP24 TaxID=2825662 RepID=A0A8S5TYN3_9CAUD|nr:MAG TPA: intron associated endonuclease [Siphoviridae sp. ctnPP24]